MNEIKPPDPNRWSISGTIKLSHGEVHNLRKWLKPGRLPRKLKKRVKADIHRFFVTGKSYSICSLINWKVKFKLK